MADTEAQKAAKEFMRKRNERTRKKQEARDISKLFKPGSGVKKAADVDKVTQSKTSKAEVDKLKGRKETESLIKRRNKLLQEL